MIGEQVMEMMKKTGDVGNILIIGNSYSGKRDLIETVLGEERTVTTVGSRRNSNLIRIYENSFLS